MYRPDNWVVIKINGPHPHYRVLAGWSGGYLDGDSWRLNSGITKVQKDFNRLFFHGSSGSTYMCLEGYYGLRDNNAHIYQKLSLAHSIELMDENTDWEKVDWLIQA
jgi:hypothetical protein